MQNKKPSWVFEAEKSMEDLEADYQDEIEQAEKDFDSLFDIRDAIPD